MCVALFGLAYPLANDLLSEWMSLPDLSRLGCACTSKFSRERFVTMVTSASLVIACPEMSRSSAFETFLCWLKFHNVYMKAFKSPTRIFDCQVLSMEGFPHFKKLLRLDLSQCEDLTDRAFVHLVERSPRLRELHVGGRSHRSWVTDHALESLAGCRDLTLLVMENLSLATDHGMALAVRGLPNLRGVTIVACPAVGDATMAALAAICHRLEALTISDNSAVTSQGLGWACDSCGELRELALHRCKTALPSTILNKSLHLKKFSYKGHKQCVASGLSSFLRHCPYLKSLHLYNVTLAEVVGIISVMPLLAHLVDIAINDSAEVVSEAVLLLLQSVYAPLQRVSLSNVQITDAVVASIAQKGTQLRELDVSWCARMSDAALVAVAEKCAQLENLDVKGCGGLTTAGVVCALNHLAALKNLNAQYCPLLQADYVRDVAARDGRAVNVVL